MEGGEGLLGRMVTDDEMAKSLLADVQGASKAVNRVATAMADDYGRDDTVFAALLRDPEGAKLVTETLGAMRDGSQALAAAAEELSTGQGTLPRLMSDREYADGFLDDLHGLVRSLHSAAAKLDSGEGTAGAFINDPQMYEDLENIVRGVKSSKVVSWFIRNRRKKGEKVAAEEAGAESATDDPTGSPPS